MRIILVGHTKTNAHVKKQIEKNFYNVEIVETVQCNTNEQVKVVNDYINIIQDRFDGILFTGKILYTIFSSVYNLTVPAAYVGSDNYNLYQTLLMASYKYGYDISKVSFDFLASVKVNEIYDQLSIDDKNLYFCNTDILQKDSIEKTAAFHKNLYLNGHTSFCITFYSEVQEILSTENIPCIKPLNNKNDAELALSILSEKLHDNNKKMSEIVALLISKDQKDEYSLAIHNDFQQMTDDYNVATAIYNFAQSIESAVIHNAKNEYFLFTNRQGFNKYYGNTSEIPLLDDVKSTTNTTISIGIGYSDNAKLAKEYASMAMSKAKREGGDCGFIARDNKITGKISRTKSMSSSDYNLDPRFQKIADRTNLSINTVFKLYTITKQTQKEHFTTQELSQLIGTSHRSMCRIIQKLEDNGYAVVAGKRILHQKGRPTRIIQLMI